MSKSKSKSLEPIPASPPPLPSQPVKRNAPRGSIPPPPPPAPAAAASTATPKPPSTAAPKKDKGKAKAEKSSEELTDLSSSSSDGDVDVDAMAVDAPPPSASTSKTTNKSPIKPSNTGRFGSNSDAAVKAWEKKFADFYPVVEVKKDEKLEDGYLVWGRLDGHPWWPGAFSSLFLPFSPLPSSLRGERS